MSDKLLLPLIEKDTKGGGHAEGTKRDSQKPHTS